MSRLSTSRSNISGTISPAFANLTSLTSLRLNDNNLTSSIPDVLATDLPRLVFLDVSNNNLSGKVPVFPSTVKFLAAGNDDLLLGCSDGSGSSTNSPTSEDEPNGFGSSTNSPTPEEASKMATFFMVLILVIIAMGLLFIYG
ncbi:hypothetical protein Vadar_030854 [Vaccinium darrowii]|uniref:Uncharacterized protein n=1 Tax=Vaccinium darrowii TaxID=229202 RepID=A0ACB7Z8R8_9ERIC|nr:hypothetical protein Vadar_030854 [Vaccinium darrowii]